MLSGSPPVVEPPRGEPPEDEESPTFPHTRGPHPALLLSIFVVVAIALTFPDISRLRTYVAGDSGDALLSLWILRRVQIGLPHGWHGLWDAPIFSPARGTLAYSDTSLPVALVHWPLRLILGDVLALNVIYLGSWVLSSWCVYRLALRFVRVWGAAFVAALVYTYAAVRLVHQQHFQLVVGGALVPLVVLLFLRLFDEPTIGRGLLLGAGLVALTLASSYYGTMTVVMVAVLATGLLLARRPEALRAHVTALAVAAAVALVLVAPVAVKYWSLQRHPEFRRQFEPALAAHVGDFTASAEHSYVLDHLPVIPRASRANSRGIENRLFPGFVAMGFGAAGALVVGVRIRRRGWRYRRGREIVVLSLAGVVALVLSFGDWIVVRGHRMYLPFAAFRRLVPGFAGMRAVARLELGFQLALAVLAAVGIDAFLRRFPVRAQAVAAFGLGAVVLAECSIALVFVRVPTAADDAGVDVALRARPAGVVLELPMGSAATNGWAYTESPRQLLALRDGDPRVNGYSGFEPAGFDVQAAALNHFPRPDALGLARRLGVRYVVLRTQLVGDVTPPSAARSIGRDGVGRYDARTAAQLVADLPPGAAVSVVRLPGGYLVELAR